MLRSIKEQAFSFLINAHSLTSLAVVIFIIFFLTKESLPFLLSTPVSDFFSPEKGWHPTEGSYYLLPMIIGTLCSSIFCLAILVPVGLAIVIALNFYPVRYLTPLTQSLMELASGIPSVVYGFWGLTTLVPWLAKINSPGQSLLAGTLILAMMILPTFALIVHNGLQSISLELKKSVSSLGISSSRAILNVYLPHIKRDIIVAAILAFCRAIGETMAVLMVCGNVIKVPGSLFDPIRTLTSNIALEMAYAVGNHRSSLFLSGLTLLVMMLILIVLSTSIRSRT